MKQAKSLVHLLFGISLLATAAYFFGGLARHGKSLLHDQVSELMSKPLKSAKPNPRSDDAVLSAADVQMSAVLGPQRKSASAENDATTPSSPASILDHVSALETGGPNHFLHRRLSVKTCQVFKFEVPLHAVRPELQGTFQTLATRRNPEGGPPVEVSLMNDEEFADFVNHRPGSTTFSSDSATGGQIHWDLNSPVVSSQKYYLVFQNSSVAQGPTIVDADFTASFQ
jgi:hypothetical protein